MAPRGPRKKAGWSSVHSSSKIGKYMGKDNRFLGVGENQAGKRGGPLLGAEKNRVSDGEDFLKKHTTVLTVSAKGSIWRCMKSSSSKIWLYGASVVMAAAGLSTAVLARPVSSSTTPPPSSGTTPGTTVPLKARPIRGSTTPLAPVTSGTGSAVSLR